jgi:6-phosphogluconolactonase
MELKVVNDPDSVARLAAATIAADARAAIAARGRFTWPSAAVTLRGSCCARWQTRTFRGPGVHLYQVDERIAPDGHPDRNLTHIRESLLASCPLRPEQVHAMPVESADLESAAAQYAADSPGDRRIAAGARPGPPRARPGWTHRLAGAWRPVLECHQCGRGTDGSLSGTAPHDLDVSGIINRARRVLWVVTGSEKTEMLQRLLDGDVRFRPEGCAANRLCCWPTAPPRAG